MSSDVSHPIVVALTGASGAVYGARLVQVLVELGRETHLTVSPPGRTVLEHELGVALAEDRFTPEEFLRNLGGALSRFRSADLAEAHDFDATLLHFHRNNDYMAAIASGSFRTAGMVICPCSGGTLAAVACGLSSNLIHRAAAVHLKERRPLILTPRETPLSLVHLDNLRRVSELGAIVLPAMPGWYQGVASLADLIDFIVARILDQLQIEHQLSTRWGDPTAD